MFSVLNMELKQRIESAVDFSGKKKSHIADEIDVSPSAITQWITGQTTAIDGVNLLRFARATGVRYEWLALEEGDMIQQGLTITDPMIIKAVQSLEKLPIEFRVEQIKGMYTLAEQIDKINPKKNGTQ